MLGTTIMVIGDGRSLVVVKSERERERESANYDGWSFVFREV